MRIERPLPHRASLVPVFEVLVPSARYEDVAYPVSLLADGSGTCRCTGYLRARRADGQCRHIDFARQRYARRATLAFLLYGA